MQKPVQRIMQFPRAFGLTWRCSKGQSNLPTYLHHSQNIPILRASFAGNSQKIILAALALKGDTIPKPDGLAMVERPDDIERSSDNVEQCSKMIEGCSHCVRESLAPSGSAWEHLNSPTRRRYLPSRSLLRALRLLRIIRCANWRACTTK
jgi:hypothetical protein